MKTKIKFVANDGSEWDDENSAHFREDMVASVDAALSLLKPVPNDCNWKGYVQQDADAVRKVKTMLFNIANQKGVLKWWIDSQKREHGQTEAELIDAHPSWFGRMLDGSHRPLERAYGRLCCIDDQDREWNQPYFVTHPEESGLFEATTDLPKRSDTQADISPNETKSPSPGRSGGY
jgi:hypothetical protein